MSKFFLLSLLTCITITLSAQKTNKEYVKYDYLRNPLEKLDASIKNYFVEIDIVWIEAEQQKKEDYEDELAKAEKEYQEALKEYNNKSLGSKVLGKALLGDDGKPKKRYVEKPTFMPQPDPSVLKSRISLDGYGQGNENTIQIKVTYQDIYISSPSDKEITKKEDKYKQRSVTVRQPVEYSLVTSDGNVIYTQVLESSSKDFVIQTKEIKAGKDWTNYISSSWETYYRSKLAEYFDNLAKEISKAINFRFGYSKIKRTTTLYKGDGKKHSYDSHLLALRTAQRAYENLYNERQESVEKLEKSIQIWEKELEEAETSNKKARINGKIAQVLMINIIEAKTLIGDYNGAIDYCDKMDMMSDVKKKYLRQVEYLRKFIKDEKLRNS